MFPGPSVRYETVVDCLGFALQAEGIDGLHGWPHWLTRSVGSILFAVTSSFQMGFWPYTLPQPRANMANGVYFLTSPRPEWRHRLKSSWSCGTEFHYSPNRAIKIESARPVSLRRVNRSATSGCNWIANVRAASFSFPINPAFFFQKLGLTR